MLFMLTLVRPQAFVGKNQAPINRRIVSHDDKTDVVFPYIFLILSFHLFEQLCLGMPCFSES